jgi:hypothetical protein
METMVISFEEKESSAVLDSGKGILPRGSVWGSWTTQGRRAQKTYVTPQYNGGSVHWEL